SNFITLTSSLWKGNPVGSGMTLVGGGSTTCPGETCAFPGTPASMMNKEGVWVDTTCSGRKSPLTAGQQLQFTWIINTPTAKTVFIGMAGDNTCQCSLN